MNNATFNGNTLNTRGARGMALRVAADLVGKAVISARSLVFRRMDSAVTCRADIGPRVGWRAVRDPLTMDGAAEVVLEALPVLRGLFNSTCSALVSLTANVGRRAAIAFANTAQINLTAYALLRGTAVFEAAANVPQNLKSWRRSPGTVAPLASISLRAGILNEFPYDEDAPEDRVFLVAPEDNVFYVVV
jgi:hypothetical protein